MLLRLVERHADGLPAARNARALASSALSFCPCWLAFWALFKRCKQRALYLPERLQNTSLSLPSSRVPPLLRALYGLPVISFRFYRGGSTRSGLTATRAWLGDDTGHLQHFRGTVPRWERRGVSPSLPSAGACRATGYRVQRPLLHFAFCLAFHAAGLPLRLPSSADCFRCAHGNALLRALVRWLFCV